MNTEVKDILYRKIRYFNRNKRKLVRFSLPANLHRSIDLEESLHTLAHNRYQEYLPAESDVWLERYDVDTPVAVFPLSEGSLWEFLYSNMWLDCTSLRVTFGQLLDRLLEAFYFLEKSGELMTYTTTVYEKNSWTKQQSCMKHSADGREETVEENLKIAFTYYGTNAASLHRAVSNFAHVLPAGTNNYTGISCDPPKTAPALATEEPTSASCRGDRVESAENVGPSLRDDSKSHSFERVSHSEDSSAERLPPDELDKLIREDARKDGCSSTISISRCSETSSSYYPDQGLVETDENCAGPASFFPNEKASDATNGSSPDGRKEKRIQYCSSGQSQALSSSSNHSPSHFHAKSPIFIKSLGIYIDPPIDTVSRKAIHFKEDHFDSGSQASDAQLSDRSVASSRDESLDAVSGQVEKTPLEKLLEEFRESFGRRRESGKRTASSILHEKACQRKSIQDKWSEDWQWVCRPLCANRDTYHEAITRVKGRDRGYQMTSRPNKIDPKSLNLRYSIDKLPIFRERRRCQEASPHGSSPKTSVVTTTLKKSKISPSLRCDTCTTSYVDETPSSKVSSIGNLSLYFDLCMEEDIRCLAAQPSQSLFFHRVPSDFSERCMKSIDDFVVRKEQVTSSRGYKTETTITFNRIVPSNY